MEEGCVTIPEVPPTAVTSAAIAAELPAKPIERTIPADNSAVNSFFMIMPPIILLRAGGSA